MAKVEGRNVHVHRRHVKGGELEKWVWMGEGSLKAEFHGFRNKINVVEICNNVYVKSWLYEYEMCRECIKWVVVWDGMFRWCLKMSRLSEYEMFIWRVSNKLTKINTEC